MSLRDGWVARARELRAERCPRGGETWTAEEEQMLEAGYRAGLAPTDLAERHQRTPAACVGRLERMGVLVAWQGAYYERPAEPYITVRQMMNIAKGISE